MKSTSQLIEQIYAAALNPADWPVALKSLQEQFACLSVGIYSVDTCCLDATPLDLRDVDPSYVRSYIDQFIYENPWTGIPQLQRPGLIRTDNMLDEYLRRPGYYRSTAYFNEWMKPQDFIHTLGTNLMSCQGVLTKLYMYRPAREGPYTRREIARFRLLLRHLVNAVEVARRLDMREAQIGGAIHFVDHLKFGAIFLDEHLHTVQANRFAEELFRCQDGLKVVQGMVTAVHRGDEKSLTGAIDAAAKAHRGESVDVPPIVSLRRTSGKRPLCVIALPLPRRPNPFFVSRAAVVLVVADPELEPVIPGEYLQQRYGLTVNEAKLAQYLVQGDELRAAADKVGLSYESARTYLKIIFQKTGTSRQPELIRVLVSDQVVIDR